MFTDWNDIEETFHMLGRGWDIRDAKRILRKKPRENDTLEVEGLRPLLPQSGFGGVLVDRARIESGDGINMDVPIILGLVKGNSSIVHLPLDGWHRIARALHLGMTSVPCATLTQRETARITSK